MTTFEYLRVVLLDWIFISGLENVLFAYIAIKIGGLKIKGNPFYEFILPLYLIRLIDIPFFYLTGGGMLGQVYTIAIMAISVMIVYNKFSDIEPIEEMSKVALSTFLKTLVITFGVQTLFIIITSCLKLQVWENTYWYSAYLPRLVMGAMYYITGTIIYQIKKG